jgi:aromatase
MNIFWEYREVAGGVEMRWVQDFHMKPQAPADDAGMTGYLNANTAIQMDRIRRLVEEAAGVQAGQGSGELAAR